MMNECVLTEKCGKSGPHTASECFLSHAVRDKELAGQLSLMAAEVARGKERATRTGRCALCDGATTHYLSCPLETLEVQIAKMAAGVTY
jgi:hypothetical protein